MKKYIAIDIGGTFIKYGLINDEATIEDNQKVKSPKELAELLDLIANITDQYVSQNSTIQGIAISSPGAVARDGYIQGWSALPYIHGPNMKELIETRTNLPAYIENDANCAALAEVWNGSAKGKKDVLAVVLGSGIGGAVIKDGYVHKGANLHGGEFGYMVMDDKQTIWSLLATPYSLVTNVAERKDVDRDSLSGEQIFDLAEQGDEVCRQEVDKFYYWLAAGIYNLQYMFDPEVILLGGGISAREELVDQVNKEIKKIMDVVEIAKVFPEIRVCKYRQHANLLGAVYGFINER